MLRPLTRVLVLSGVVTLTTALGSVDGTAGDLLAAESGTAPAKLAVEANSDFAFQLYKQLAIDDPESVAPDAALRCIGRDESAPRKK